MSSVRVLCPQRTLPCHFCQHASVSEMCQWNTPRPCLLLRQAYEAAAFKQCHWPREFAVALCWRVAVPAPGQQDPHQSVHKHKEPKEGSGIRQHRFEEFKD